jgi:hypothetical protein
MKTEHLKRLIKASNVGIFPHLTIEANKSTQTINKAPELKFGGKRYTGSTGE